MVQKRRLDDTRYRELAGTARRYGIDGAARCYRKDD